MVLSTFIGPDGTPLLHRHDTDTCECEECQAVRDARMEREARRVVGELDRIEATQYTRNIIVKLPAK
jgi:hypothetical protein